jgi:hypothetical protein
LGWQVSSTSSRAFDALKRATRHVFNAPVAPMIMTGNTDTRHYWCGGGMAQRHRGMDRRGYRIDPPAMRHSLRVMRAHAARMRAALDPSQGVPAEPCMPVCGCMLRCVLPGVCLRAARGLAEDIYRFTPVVMDIEEVAMFHGAPRPRGVLRVPSCRRPNEYSAPASRPLDFGAGGRRRSF